MSRSPALGRGAATRAHDPSVVAATASATAAQLTLDLPAPLPQLGIEPDWKQQPRLWGHSFHPMCSYLASFPASLAHAFIARYSRPGDVVFDPFAGRGTTPLQASAEGRIGVGNDLNPFAHLLTAAKVEPATPAEARTRLTALRLAWGGGGDEWVARAHAIQTGARTLDADGRAAERAPTAGPSATRNSGEVEVVPAEVAIAFAPRTFAQLLFLRSALDPTERVDRFLLATTSGILHGKTPSYLSDLMPNTFSMAPRYVRTFAERTGYAPRERDAFAAIGAKLDRLYRSGLPSAPGLALLGDARDAGVRGRAALRARGLPDRARLVVTSPPYLRTVKYGYYNWLRAWFLGYDSREIDATLDDAHRREPYLVFLRQVLAGLRTALTDDAVVVFVVGDVATDRGRRSSDGIGLAEQVWESSAEPEGYRLAGIALDDVHAHRKMTKLWGPEAGRATQTDRILVLAASEAGRRRAISGAPLPVDWTWPPRLRAL